MELVASKALIPDWNLEPDGWGVHMLLAILSGLTEAL